jgi:hypothetical protein
VGHDCMPPTAIFETSFRAAAVLVADVVCSGSPLGHGGKKRRWVGVPCRFTASRL